MGTGNIGRRKKAGTAKTKEGLTNGLVAARQKIADPEASKLESSQAEEALRQSEARYRPFSRSRLRRLTEG